ncbi:hypothetical protein FRC07_006308 [Ceratobasidium sp. 392]|nr:hypothetical protein FRC07_006308 [Ceratobasidium sp. 392]
MSTPSAAGQAVRAQNRGLEVFKARLETLETQHKTQVESLTERLRLAEAEMQGLREANVRLNSCNEGLCQRVADLETYRVLSEQQVRVLGSKLSYEATRLDVATADLEVIAPELTIKTSDDGPTAGTGETGNLGGASAPVTSGSAALSADAEAEAAKIRSQEARDSEAMGDAVGSVLFSLYRVNNFKNIADKHYPHVPMDHDEWPHSIKPNGGRENHMRLNFEEAYDSETNWPWIERWVAAVREQGAIRVPAAEPYLAVIGDDDLLDRVKKRFNWEKRTYKKAMGGTPIPTKCQSSEGYSIEYELK